MIGKVLVSDRPVEEWEQFLLELMNGASDCSVRGLAVVAFLDKPTEDGGDAMTAYYNMSLRDRCYAADLIRTDVTRKIAQEAVWDVLDPPDPDEEV